MPTQAQLDLAKKYGYTQDQINQEMTTPGSVKKTDINRTTTTPTPYVEQNILSPNVTGRTTPTQSNSTNASGFVPNNSGNITTQPMPGSAADNSQQVNIGTSYAPLYVPKGSAGEQNYNASQGNATTKGPGIPTGPGGIDQVNIGSAEAPLYVPRGSAGYQNYVSQGNATNGSGFQPGQPAPGSAGSILGDGFGSEDEFTKKYWEDKRNEYNQTIDPQAAYNEQLALRQAQIDATNALYRDQLNQARIQGQGRLGSGGAIQARRGLLGSSFGEAQTNRIQDVNTGIENSIEQERLAVVNQIMTNARESAAADIAEKRRAKEAGGKAYLEYLAGASTRKAEKVSKAAQLLLSLGKSPQDISDEELKQAGISRQDLTMEYTAGKSAQEQSNAEAKAKAEKAALENLKVQSEINKNEAQISNDEAKLILEALKTGRVYESGGFIFDGNTNEVIGNAQAVTRARASGGGGGGATSGVLGGVGAGGTNTATEQGRLALEQALAQKGLTGQQRQALINLYNSQGTTGLKTYVYNNMLTATQKDEFNNFSNGGAILGNVSNEIGEEEKFGYWQDIGQSILSRIGLQDRNYSDIKSRIEVAQAPIRKGLYGTALTGTEAETAKSFLIDFKKDTGDIIKQKSKNLEGTLKYVNDANIAGSLGLPKPNYYDYITPVVSSTKSPVQPQANSTTLSNGTTINFD